MAFDRMLSKGEMFVLDQLNAGKDLIFRDGYFEIYGHPVSRHLVRRLLATGLITLTEADEKYKLTEQGKSIFMKHNIGALYIVEGFPNRIFRLVCVAANTYTLEDYNKGGIYLREPLEVDGLITDEVMLKLTGDHAFGFYRPAYSQGAGRTVLEEANELIFGERAKAYGNAEANFRRIATGWSTILGTTVTAEQVGLCMAWLKIARQVGKPNRDNLVDAAGYLGCVEKVQKGE